MSVGPGEPSAALASLYISQCVLLFSSGRYDEALIAADSGRAVAHEIQDTRLSVECEMRRATILMLLDRWREAATALEAALPAAWKGDDLSGLVSTLHNLAVVRFNLGEMEQVLTLLNP